MRIDFLPNSQASPSLAGSRPVSIFMVVDLPQPLEPESRRSRRAGCGSHVVHGDEVAEAHGQPSRLDGDVVLAARSGGITTAGGRAFPRAAGR
jgi:hypothetical protein